MNAISSPVYDVCIVGGGPAGLTLALALADTELSIAVVTKDATAVQEPVTDGRYYSIAAGCWNIWRAIGIENHLIDKAEPISEISAEAAGGKPILFDNMDLQTNDDRLGYMIGASSLSAELYRAATSHPGITLFHQHVVKALNSGAFQTELKLEGAVGGLSARLIVGCDGRQSIVRRLSGIRWFGHDYDASSIACIVQLSQPHEGRARQTFLKTGPLAVLPLPNNCANVIWSEQRDVAESLTAMTAESFARELESRAGDFIGKFTVKGPRFSYPLTMRVAERFFKDRVALAGDAAHAIHPLAGQGLNLGLKDVAVLAEEIVTTDRLGLDIGAGNVLSNYDAHRRPDVVSTAIAMDVFDRLFTAAPSSLRGLAGTGMEWVGSIASLRTQLARQASAVSDRAPQLMKGLSLNLC